MLQIPSSLTSFTLPWQKLSKNSANLVEYFFRKGDKCTKCHPGFRVVKNQKGSMTYRDSPPDFVVNKFQGRMDFKVIGRVPGSKNMSSLFCRTHCCGFNTFYGMSKFNSVPKIWPIQFSESWLLYRKWRGNFWCFFLYICPYSLQYWCCKHQICHKDADYE